jgi:hypothetical protein
MAESCRRDPPVTFQTMWNTDNLDAPAWSLQYLIDSAKGLQDALQRGFAMGIKIARFDLTNNLEDYRVTLERIAMAAQWNDDLKS